MIPILGMHRSGTSAVAGAIHKLGADLGPESGLIPPASDNPRGFFENSAVVNLNRRILSALGGSWLAPPPLPESWIEDNRITDERSSVRELTATLLRGIVVKDPRLSLLQPLWDDASPAEPALLCVRHPVAVAKSLQARNQLTLTEGLYLWFRYNSAALINRPDALVVHYHELLNEPSLHLFRIAEHIGLEVNDLLVKNAAMMLHPESSHHDADIDMSTLPIGEMCAALYSLLLTARDPADEPQVLLFARVIGTTTQWASANVQVSESNFLKKRIRLLEDDASGMRHRIERLQSELRHALRVIDNESMWAALSISKRDPEGSR